VASVGYIGYTFTMLPDGSLLEWSTRPEVFPPGDITVDEAAKSMFHDMTEDKFLFNHWSGA